MSTVLTRGHRDPLVTEALRLASAWCHGHRVDGVPAIAHAVKVARTLGDHVPDAPPPLVAACLLHGGIEYAPNVVDTTVATRFGAEALRIVRVFRCAHRAVTAHQHAPEGARDHLATVAASDRAAVLATAADVIVTLDSALRHGERAPDPAAYWAARALLLDQVGYFQLFVAHTAPHLPAGMIAHLSRLAAHAQTARAVGHTVHPPRPPEP